MIVSLSIKFYYRLIATVLTLSLFLSSLTSCTTSYRAGDVKELEEIPGSEEIINYDYAIIKVGHPTLELPVAKFKIKRTPNNKIKAKQKLIEEEWRNDIWLSAIFVATCSALSVLFFTTPIVYDADEGKNIKSVPAGISFGALAVLVGFVGFNNHKTGETDNLLDGEIVDDFEKGTPETAPGVNIMVRAGGIEKNYNSDKDGIISINLVKDLSLVRFDRPQTVYVECTSVYHKIKERYTLNSKDWTVPHIKIIQDGVAVETEKEGQLVKLGELKSGEEYKILHEGNDLIKIEFNGEEGFIPKDAGDKFWAVDNYLESNK